MMTTNFRRRGCDGCGHITYCGKTKYDSVVIQTSVVGINLKCDSTAIAVRNNTFPTIQDMIMNCKDLTLEDTLLWTKFIKEHKI